MEKIEKLKREFENKFTYLAGDGRRMNANTEVPKALFEWIIKQIEKQHEKPL